MNKWLIIICVAPFPPLLAEAVSVPDPASTDVVLPGAEFDVHLSDFGGIPVDGQSMSVDVRWADTIVARVLLMVGTDQAVTGFAASRTGQLLTANGGTLSTVHARGSAQSSNGEFSAWIIAAAVLTVGGVIWVQRRLRRYAVRRDVR
jgi:hypothetical protein